LIGVSCFLPFAAGINHALYIGMVELHFPEKGNTATLQVRVFADDLKSGVRAAFPARFRPAEGEKWLELHRKSVENYFRQKLVFRHGNKTLELSLTQVRQENEMFHLDFVLQCPKGWETLHLRADFLAELFPTQSNVVKWEKGGGVPHFARATQNAPEVVISL